METYLLGWFFPELLLGKEERTKRWMDGWVDAWMDGWRRNE